ATTMGVLPADGPPVLNPPMDRPLRESDQLLVIAADSSAIEATAAPTGTDVDTSRIVEARPTVETPVRTLILGWNRRGAAIVGELDPYVPSGSYLLVV